MTFGDDFASVDTAGAPAFGGPRIVDLRLDRARALMDELVTGLRASAIRHAP